MVPAVYDRATGLSRVHTRPEGNVMVDVQRYSAPLARRHEALGGVRCTRRISPTTPGTSSE